MLRRKSKRKKLFKTPAVFSESAGEISFVSIKRAAFRLFANAARMNMVELRGIEPLAF